MGKQALVAIAGILVLGAAIWRIDSVAIQTVCVGLIFLVALMGLFTISFHGHRHPVEATLEGAEIVWSLWIFRQSNRH